jgi:hypothetical protein
LSSKVEQLLKRWEREGTLLKIELASKYIAVFGSGIVSSFHADQLLLDGESGCGYKISLRDATYDSPDIDSLANPLRVSESEVMVAQLQIAVPENQRVLLSEIRRLT